MTKKLPFLSALLTGAAMLFCTEGKAQINYTEDFEADQITWDDDNYDFYAVDDHSCSGYSLNSFFYATWEIFAHTGSIGTSNGTPATLSYDFKIVDIHTYEAYPNTPDWGDVYLEYSYTENGPWLIADHITPENNVETDECTTRTVTFYPPAGYNTYLRIRAIANAQEGTDAAIYFDNFSVVQPTTLEACSGTPDASQTVSSVALNCLGGDTILQLSPAYTTAVAYQWQLSENGTDFTDVTGATSSSYIATVNGNVWYRAIVTCATSGESITSTPFATTTTGLPCYCEVVFEDSIEPISHVSFAGIDNASDAALGVNPGYENFMSLAPGVVTPGETYTISVQGNSDGFNETFITVFLDFNRNGNFNDEGEIFPIATALTETDGTDGVTVSREITIPANITEGPVAMRVMKFYGTLPTDACDTSDSIGYGQAEDYLINVVTEIECNLETPVAAAEQSFCNEANLSDLTAQAFGNNDVIWYAAEDATEPISENIALVNGGTYYVAASNDDCESARAAITVTITVVPAITGEATQVFTVDTELPVTDLEVTVAEGATLTWYASAEDAANAENPLAADYVITENGTYYAVQNIGECSSELFAVAVEVTLNSTGFNKSAFSYYPNPVSGALTLSYSNEMSNVEVFNLLGQKVLQSAAKATTATLDMGSLQAGTYLVKVTDANSNTTVVKVIKQ